MFIDAQKQGYQNELRFFLLLKLMYRDGKVGLDNADLKFIEFVEQIKLRKTSVRYIKFLLELGFLRYNSKTGFYLLQSFDTIREMQNWKSRLAFRIDFSNYYKIQAVTGAVVYGYLHKVYWRNVKRKRSVPIKGSTYHSLSLTYNYKQQFAPVSVIGIKKIFGISQAAASRLKNAAVAEKYIKVKKNFSEPISNKILVERALQYNDMPNKIVYHNHEYRLQLIDTICPLFFFTKRTKLKT
ncbi:MULTISPECIES: hypothetical protein [Flavobacterium]|uniref:hypothetical protein n=1 Tax=Flavobacterium TaxID=237 RepID=UPI001FCBD8B9|nr:MULTISPECIES: hypothetical protein [Flavobacterium]UOK41589.1 hypothetical protein LZF87_09730 [Flavobacterium enshiense]